MTRRTAKGFREAQIDAAGYVTFGAKKRAASGETEMVLRVARAISGAPFPSPKSITKARAAIWAMKDPTCETNEAICKDQPREFHVPMQLGYERGLDAALGEVS